jgi:hypothetical protein
MIPPHIIISGLTVNDKLIAAKSATINETVSRSFQDEIREVNVYSTIFNSTSTENFIPFPTELVYEYYYDKQTGIIVEFKSNAVTYNPNDTSLKSTFQQFMTLESTNRWTVPEFPTRVLVIIFLSTATLLGTVVIKRKQFRIK